MFTKTAHIKIVLAIAEGLKKANKLGNYLELGIRRASCFNIIASLAKKAYAVDINDCQKYIVGINSERINWFHGSTNEFFNYIKNDNIEFDLVFIDADHGHEQSLRDFEMAFDKTRDDGIILLHDTYPPNEKFLGDHYCGDTYKTANYIKINHTKYCEITTLPFYYGISIARKSKKQLLWMDE